ncbi:MAG: hypothetical protein RJA70_4001 [Pseudomonadota bacterium]|jgi:hypothetical protein
MGIETKPRSGVVPRNPVPTETVRAQVIWHGWLQQLASDPEAALAAALAYRELDGGSRDEWLDALDSDADHSEVSKVAVYAPLLAVEQDPSRRSRIGKALQSGASEADRRAARVGLLRARDREGRCLAVITRPLYLDFVQTLACCYVPGRSFEWVRHDPIARRTQAPAAGSMLEGQVLEAVPREALLDELAETILSHRRLGGELPEALCLFADLFGPSPAQFLEAQSLGAGDDWRSEP